ncbi:MAG: GDP-mannose 4,6-dehydratase [Bdellovibrionia bacterium]
MSTAIILGSSGQDGILLGELLSNKGYKVIGVGDSSEWDITQPKRVRELILSVKPSEIYHLAAIHHSSEESGSENSDFTRRTFEVNFHSLIHFLESIRNDSPKTRIFYAASSHIFGHPSAAIQCESTPLRPDSSYAISKANGLLACRKFRKKYGLFASVGILYNHESNLRSEKFLSMKIIKTALAIRSGQQDHLVIGDLNATIDWGYAGDYVEAMYRILQLPTSDEFIVATGEGHTVREFIQIVFDSLDLDPEKYVRQDPSILTRRGPVRIGDPAKLIRQTGWKPMFKFEEMVKMLLKIESSKKAK